MKSSKGKFFVRFNEKFSFRKRIRKKAPKRKLIGDDLSISSDSSIDNKNDDESMEKSENVIENDESNEKQIDDDESNAKQIEDDDDESMPILKKQSRKLETDLDEDEDEDLTNRRPMKKARRQLASSSEDEEN